MEGLGSFLLFAIFFYIMMRYGCGAHMIHGGHGHGGGDKGHDHTKNKAIDPVCNMEVEENQGYGKMYESQLYRFCSRRCLDKFEADPQRYINKPPQEDMS